MKPYAYSERTASSDNAAKGSPGTIDDCGQQALTPSPESPPTSYAGHRSTARISRYAAFPSDVCPPPVAAHGNRGASGPTGDTDRRHEPPDTASIPPPRDDTRPSCRWLELETPSEGLAARLPPSLREPRNDRDRLANALNTGDYTRDTSRRAIIPSTGAAADNDVVMQPPDSGMLPYDTRRRSPVLSYEAAGSDIGR